MIRWEPILPKIVLSSQISDSSVDIAHLKTDEFMYICSQTANLHGFLILNPTSPYPKIIPYC